MLIRLENGDWVDPQAVTAVEFFPSHESMLYPYTTAIARVRLTLGASTVIVPFRSDGDAMEARDRIAAQINEAREAQR